MKDVQSYPDSRGIRIQKVGIKKVHIPLQILTKDGRYQNVTGIISLCADLTENARGTHMSRFMEIITRWSKKKISSKEVKIILEEVRNELETDRAQISIHFKYFMEKTSPVSHSKGFIDYDCLFYGLLEDDLFSFILGVKIPVQLVCPCSKEISREGAHNQRADINIKLEYYPDEFIWLEDLILDIESLGSSPVYPIIKREDEKYITEMSFGNPKFVEDVIRDVVEKSRKDDRVRWFQVECDSYESIHNHNAFAYQKEYIGKKSETGLIPYNHLNFMFR
ncbi:MAG: GTP cyclohydrolase FolE2 [Candidatus Eremiobacteraeota bacterium]|nr:GTP cyclohydrolase FolE2 [Candidatus Eremiobacteraeota bacterium]